VSAKALLAESPEQRFPAAGLAAVAVFREAPRDSESAWSFRESVPVLVVVLDHLARELVAV
jgi:hypothetical protein